MRLLAGLCQSIEDEEPKPTGRPRIPRADLAFLTCYKVFEGVSTRRFIPDVEIAHRSGFISCEPQFNSIINAMNDPNMTSEVVIERRHSIRMLCGDIFVNNTDYDVCVEDEDGEAIRMIDPGGVFEAESDLTIFFSSNFQYAFRSYLNMGYRRN